MIVRKQQDDGGARLLLLLISEAQQNAAQLSAGSHLSLTETLRQLRRLSDRGFIIAATDQATETPLYHVCPRSARCKNVDPRQRILLVDDDPSLGRLMLRLLEEDGYAVLTVSLPTDAVTLLMDVAFDLVLTDAFSPTSDGVLIGAADILVAAGATPVALFTAHSLRLDRALGAGFSDLIEKPFDINEFGQHIRALMPAMA